MRTRTLSAFVIVPVLAVAVALGTPGIAVLLAILAAIGGSEVFRLLKGAGYPSLPWVGTVIAVAFVGAAYVAPKGDLGLLLAAVGVVVAGVGAFAQKDPKDGLVVWFSTVFGALYVGLVSFVLVVAGLGPELPAGAALAGIGRDRAWILLLVLGVWAFDTGAFLVGRQIGRHKFIEHISPAKSVEGVIGGLVATTLVSCGLLAALGQDPLGGIVLGPLLGITAQAGDLAESMLKRAAGAKDSGTLIPGHGGVLDRIDSFLFAAPVVALYVVALVR